MKEKLEKKTDLEVTLEEEETEDRLTPIDNWDRLLLDQATDHQNTS